MSLISRNRSDLDQPVEFRNKTDGMRSIAFRVEPEKRLSSVCGSEMERAVLVKYLADTASPHPAMAERMVFKAAGVILHLWEKAERRT